MRAEWAGRVLVDLILNDGSICCTFHLPAAWIDLENLKRLAGAILGANPIDVLGEIANLIKSIPYRKLKFAVAGAGRQHDLHLHKMLLGRC